VLHLAFLLVSTYFGLRFLNAGFSAQEDRSGGGIKVWMVIFLLVLLQMTTALRPWIGKADAFLPTEKKFFVTHWLDCTSGCPSGQTFIEFRTTLSANPDALQILSTPRGDH